MVLNSHLTKNLYRFHAFAKQKSHNTSLLLLSALLQGYRHLVELFPRPMPPIGSLHIPYTQWYWLYTRFLIQLFPFPTERPLYSVMVTAQFTLISFMHLHSWLMDTYGISYILNQGVGIQNSSYWIIKILVLWNKRWYWKMFGYMALMWKKNICICHNYSN